MFNSWGRTEHCVFSYLSKPVILGLACFYWEMYSFYLNVYDFIIFLKGIVKSEMCVMRQYEWRLHLFLLSLTSALHSVYCALSIHKLFHSTYSSAWYTAPAHFSLESRGCSPGPASGFHHNLCDKNISSHFLPLIFSIMEKLISALIVDRKFLGGILWMFHLSLTHPMLLCVHMLTTLEFDRWVSLSLL